MYAASALPHCGLIPHTSLHAGLDPFPITTGSLAQVSKHLWVWSHIPQNTTPQRVSQSPVVLGQLVGNSALPERGMGSLELLGQT